MSFNQTVYVTTYLEALSTDLPAIIELANDHDMVLEKFGEGYIRPGNFEFTGILSVEEVAYGQLDEEFKIALFDAGIPFDATWSEHDLLDAGSDSLRLDENGRRRFREKRTWNTDPPIDELEKLLDSPGELVAYLRQFIEDRHQLDWTDQIKNAGVFKAARLLDPDWDNENRWF